jgi:hypothetical protein
MAINDETLSVLMGQFNALIATVGAVVGTLRATGLITSANEEKIFTVADEFLGTEPAPCSSEMIALMREAARRIVATPSA